MFLNGDTPQRRSHISFMSPPKKTKFLKCGYASAKFKRLAEERDEVSQFMASSSGHGLREHLTGVFAKKKLLIGFLS